MLLRMSIVLLSRARRIEFAEFGNMDLVAGDGKNADVDFVALFLKNSSTTPLIFLRRWRKASFGLASESA